MKNFQKFLIFSLCLLCWHCSCDNKIDIEIPIKRPDTDEHAVHSETPFIEKLNLQQENVNIPHVETQSHDQKIAAKEIKSPNIKKVLHNVDIRISKFKEQLRKMRRREITIGPLNDKKKQISSVGDNVNTVKMDITNPNSDSRNNYEASAKKIQSNVHKTESEQLKIPETFPKSEEIAGSQSTSHKLETADDKVQKASSSESSNQLETPESSQHPHSEAMPSFDEWKKMMLAEQEKDGLKVPSVNPPGKKITSQKRHRNYASYECGAKIVASNSEAEGTSRILNERLDEYMLNPCKAKAWFVIELCETVQVSQIELANFELFSSCPKDFTVSFSDSFPTRDWVHVGKFTAAEQRVLQGFQAKSEGFIKFIKVELLSHYGKEHYCPLNVIRVFGTSMVDEYEEMEKMSDHHASSDDDLDRLDIPVEDKRSSNIFGSATDAVYNIVKKAAQVLGQHQPEESPEKGIEQNISEAQHCKLLDQNCIAESNKTYIESSTSDFPNTIHKSLYHHLKQCDKCISIPHSLPYSIAPLPQCQFFQIAFGPVYFKNICDWFKDHYLLPLQESSPVDIVQSNTTSDEQNQSSSTTIISVIIDSESRGEAMPSYSDMTSSLPAVDAPLKETSQLPSSSKTAKEKNNEIDKISKPTIQPTKTLSTAKDGFHGDFSGTPKIETSVNKVTSGTMSEDKVDNEIKSSMEAFSVKTDDASAKTHIPLHTPIPVQNITKKLESGEKLEKSEEKLESIENEQLTLELENGNIENLIVEPGSVDSKIGEISKDSTTKMDSAIVGSASQKESVFVRMNNRIKALELNMSLSSQYLEELSQRYRRQMEEMQRAFNRTIGTLNDTARKATEQDLKQQEIIGNLQSQLSNLTLTVDHIMEKHIFLMVAEAIVMITVMSLCVRRISSSVPRHSVPHIVTVSGDVTRLSRSDMKRRNSSGSCSPPCLKRIKKRSSSDEALHTDELLIIEPTKPVIMDPPPKIKKKKRKKHMKRSSSNPVTSPRKSLTTSLKKLLKVDTTCTAGLLFTHTNSEKDNVNHSCENCSKDNSEKCDSRQFYSVEKRTNAIPLKNLTNGDLNLPHHICEVAATNDKFSFRKFVKFQKRESI